MCIEDKEGERERKTTKFENSHCGIQRRSKVVNCYNFSFRQLRPFSCEEHPTTHTEREESEGDSENGSKSTQAFGVPSVVDLHTVGNSNARTHTHPCTHTTVVLYVYSYNSVL